MPLRGIRLRGGAISPCRAQYAPLLWGAAMPLRGIRLRGGAISPCGAQYAPLCAAIVDTIRRTFALTPYSQTATSSTTPKKTEFHSISARDIRFACSKFKKIHKNEIFLDLGAICG